MIYRKWEEEATRKVYKSDTFEISVFIHIVRFTTMIIFGRHADLVMTL